MDLPSATICEDECSLSNQDVIVTESSELQTSESVIIDYDKVNDHFLTTANGVRTSKKRIEIYKLYEQWLIFCICVQIKFCYLLFLTLIWMSFGFELHKTSAQ